MPTEPNDSTVARAPTQLNLTAAGWAVIVMAVAAIFISAQRRVAIGFMIPLVAALAIDLYLSWYVLSHRQVSIRPGRTVVYHPHGIPLSIEANGRSTPLLVKIVLRGAEDRTVSVTDERVLVEWNPLRTGVVNYMRCNVSCSVFGLALAQRWQTHLTPMLHWAPAPREVQLVRPEAIDEVSRLREYVPGDRMSRVSWPTTARTGRMHVRAAGEGHEEFVVVVNLGGTTGEAGESAVVDGFTARQLAAGGIEGEGNVGDHLSAVLDETLRLAATLISQLLEDGHQVRLLTSEFDPEVLSALRRSAIDTPRLAEELPPGLVAEPVVVDQFVLDDDQLARRLARAEAGADLTWGYGSYVDVSMLGIRTMP